MINFCYILILGIFKIIIVSGQQTSGLYPQVTIPSGTIRGYYDTATNGREFAAFEGIPYASPPLGKNRFREPQPVNPWKGIWIANHTVKCLQYDHLLLHTENPVHGEEDCLYLNVYTPQINQKAQFDVIVFIHGGCFQFRTSYTNRPHFLLENNIVFVTFNYRLGPLGFLSTEDDVVPGNNGLKDQNAALKWVRDNIKYFGGNPSSVTITGHSAGGASVSYHYLSPMSAGLFHRGIAKSGIALMPWAQTERSLEKAKKLAASVGCNLESNRDMVDCMRYRPGYRIVENVKLFLYYLYNPFTPFGPVVEKSGSNPFISESPIDILLKGKVNDVPLIISAVRDEGLYPGAEFVSDPAYLPEIEQRWEELSPYLLDYNYTVPKLQHGITAQKIKSYYFKNQPISRATFNELVQAIGDRLFVAPLELGAKLFAKALNSPVYFIYFTYRGANSNSILLSRSKENLGVCHSDDLIYVLNYAYCQELVNDDKLMKSLIIKNWLTFAKTGVPVYGNIQPNRIIPTKKVLDYVHIESPKKISRKTAGTLSHKQFWNSLPFQENEKSISTKEEL